MAKKVFYEVAKKIDKALSENLVSENVLNQIKESPYQNYFFRNVRSVQWFYPLKEEGYFSPDNAPGPIEAEGKGHFIIPQWNVLPYLEAVSEQVSTRSNEEYFEELLSIIQQVTACHLHKKKNLDNYRTWWYFVKILLRIPNDKITFDVIELMPVWLESRFDNSLPARDIATKLLPKFLDSSNAKDWTKAEKILKSIIAIKWFEMPEDMKKGIFGKEREARTLVDSDWLLDAFKENATKVGEKCSENVIFAIADTLKEIFRSSHPVSTLIVEHKGQRYQISVQHSKDYEFDCSVARIIKGVEVEIEKVFDFGIENCKDKDSFGDILRQKVIEHPEFENLNDGLNKKIMDLYDGTFSDYSYVWFQSIASGSGLSAQDPKQTLTLILRDIVLVKVEKNRSTARTIFDKFLSGEYQYPLFKRIVLFLVGKYWDDFRDTFWDLMKEDGEHLFENPNFKLEIFTLLQENVNKLTSEEKTKIKYIIEKGPQKYLPEDNQDRYIAKWKQEWYLALKSDVDFVKLYEDQKKITQREVEIPIPVRFESRIGAGPSPLSKEEILTMSNEELLVLLKKFKTVDHWEGPSVEALSLALKDATQERPEKFIENLSPFLDVGYLYVYRILYGIKDAWNQKKTIDWEKPLEFTKQYVDRDDFWQDKFKIKDDDLGAAHGWVTGMIGELLEDGTKDDAWAFPEKHLPVAQEILFLILDKQEPAQWQSEDSVTYSLNTPFGKLIAALILLALRIARIEVKQGVKKDIKWTEEVKNKYEELLKNDIVEAYTLLGQYLINFDYLDKDWVKGKIEGISLEENEKLWKGFMEGYLLADPVYEKLYKLMKAHYSTAIEYDFKETHTNQRLVQHVSLQYLHGKESIDDTEGLFRRLLNRWKPSQMEEIISFFWMQREHFGENPKDNSKAKMQTKIRDMLDRIIDFWKWVYDNKYKDRQPAELDDKDKRFLSNLSELTVFLSKIDSENVNWLILSAPYVDIDFKSSFFIEYLDNLKDRDKETTQYVGQIFIKMLDGTTPEYDQIHVRSIVKYLYKSGEKENADNICNTYGLRGLHFLRDLWEKCQSEGSADSKSISEHPGEHRKTQDKFELTAGLTLLKTIGKRMTEKPQLHSVLRAITKAINLIVSVDIPLIYLWDSEKEDFGKVVYGDIRGAWRRSISREVEPGSGWKVVHTEDLCIIRGNQVHEFSREKGVKVTAAYPVKYEDQLIAVLYMDYLTQPGDLEYRKVFLERLVKKIGPIIEELEFDSKKSQDQLEELKDQFSERLREEQIIDEIDQLMGADIYLITLYNEKVTPRFWQIIFGELSREWEIKCKPRAKVMDGTGIIALEKAEEGKGFLDIVEEAKIHWYPRSKGVKRSATLALTYERRRLGVIYMHFLGLPEKLEGDLKKLEELKDAIEIFGHLASLAIKNALWLKDLERLRNIMRGLTSNLDLDETAKNIARQIVKVIPGSIPNLYLYNPEKIEEEQFKFLAGSGKGDEISLGDVHPRSKEKNGIGQWVIRQRKHLIRHADEKSDDKPDISPDARKWGSQTVGCWPLMFKDKVLGLLYLHFKQKHEFTDEEKLKCSMFANQTALAIHNAQIFTGLWETKDRLVIAAENLVKGTGNFGPSIDFRGKDNFENLTRRLTEPLDQASANELEVLFRRLFWENEKITILPIDKLGFGGAAVVMVRPERKIGSSRNEVVVKFGKRKDIEKEKDKYKECIQGLLGGNRYTSMTSFAETPNLAAISYSFVGGITEDMQKFDDYFESKSTLAIQNAIRKLFDETCGRCYLDKKGPVKMNLDQLYTKLPFFPIQKMLEETFDRYFKQTEAHQWVVFRDKHWLKFTGVDHEVINPLWWLKELRQELNRGHHRKLFSQDVYLCINHGDLRGPNIFADNQGNCWLIDFADAGETHLLNDFTKLETTTKFELLDLEIFEEMKDLSDLYAFEESLCSPRTFRQSMKIELPNIRYNSEKLSKAFLAVKKIREMAFEKNERRDDMQEYFVGLFFQSLRLCRSKVLEDHMINRVYALMSAALLAEKLQERL